LPEVQSSGMYPWGLGTSRFGRRFLLSGSFVSPVINQLSMPL
jgi:hypothetical protein